jgi:hypothetical protein
MRKGEKKFVSAMPTTRQTTPYELEKAYKTIAFSRSNKVEYKNLDDLDNEASRIRRCVEHYYTYSNHDLSFSDFCTKFIMENFKEMVFGTEFDGTYLDDLEVNRADEYIDDYRLVA